MLALPPCSPAQSATKPIEAGRAVGERVDDPWDDDSRPELGWFCEDCAEREFGYHRSHGV